MASPAARAPQAQSTDQWRGQTRRDAGRIDRRPAERPILRTRAEKTFAGILESRLFTDNTSVFIACPVEGGPDLLVARLSDRDLSPTADARIVSVRTIAICVDASMIRLVDEATGRYDS